MQIFANPIFMNRFLSGFFALCQVRQQFILWSNFPLRAGFTQAFLRLRGDKRSRHVFKPDRNLQAQRKQGELPGGEEKDWGNDRCEGYGRQAADDSDAK